MELGGIQRTFDTNHAAAVKDGISPTFEGISKAKGSLF